MNGRSVWLVVFALIFGPSPSFAAEPDHACEYRVELRAGVSASGVGPGKSFTGKIVVSE